MWLDSRGEITTSAIFDYGKVVGETLQEIGYDADYAQGTDYSYTCKFEKGAFLMNMLGQFRSTWMASCARSQMASSVYGSSI